ncbi:MAG: M28 family peptidase [Phycisphaerae bacterium]
MSEDRSGRTGCPGTMRATGAAYLQPLMWIGLLCLIANLSCGGQKPFVDTLFQSVAPDDAPEAAATADSGVEMERRLISHVRQLTFEGSRAGEGYFNRDGLQFVFQSEREPGNPFFQIYMMDLETGDVKRVSPGRGKTTCAWIHPDGHKVLFSSTHDDPAARDKQQAEIDLRASGQQRRYQWDRDEHYDIYQRDLDSGVLSRLTDTLGYDAEASWSPDGERIVFASNRMAYSEPLSHDDREKFDADKSFLMDVYIMNADGSGAQRLTTAKGCDGGPFFSPDGRRICWRRFSEDGATAEIFTMNTDGSDQEQITSMGAMSWAPFYHPSGEYVIFTTNRHGFDNFELYMVATDGGMEPVRVTYTPRFDGLPAFSPDGNKLAWTSMRTPKQQSQIFLADWNHAGAIVLLRRSPQSEPRAQATGPHNPSRFDRLESRSHTVADSDLQRDGRTTRPDICAEDLKLHVSRLASDDMEGRLTGTEGERLATEYVARVFQRIGMAPAGDDGTYFQHFTFTAGMALGDDNSLTMYGSGEDARTEFEVDRDWRPLAFSRDGVFEAAEVVFAGYGIAAPASGEFEEYDSFVHLEVKGKWVMVLRYMPEDISQEDRQHLARHASLRYKVMIVRDKGAYGLIVVSGPNSKVRSELIKLGFDASLSGTSIPGVSITNAVADKLLASSRRTLKSLQDGLDTGKLRAGFVLPQVKLAVDIDLKKVTRTGRNVLGRLKSAAGARITAGARILSRTPLPRLIVGAHVDHLGRGGGGGSLARGDEKDQIHYGADDNASGVAAVLEIAEQLADRQRRGKLGPLRDIEFAAWSGEELGLLGSKHYVDAVAQETLDRESLLGPSRQELGETDDLTQSPRIAIRGFIAAYINLDMVGRLDQHVILNGIGSSSIWRREVERRNVPVGLPLSLNDDSYMPSDATSFYIKGVPILNVFTGSHPEYHTPRDTADRLDYRGMTDIARFIGLIAGSVAANAETPDYIAQEKPENLAPRAGLRAYLGTIPDYGEAEIAGLKLSGVATGGPAHEAGLKGNDIIVSLAGRTIENIYDYTYAIDALKIGQPAEVIVVREGRRITLTIVPGSRE